jgi:hypothetical protein
MDEQMKRIHYQQFLDLTTDTWDFHLEGEQTDPTVTFSSEGMKMLVEFIAIFMTARISRRWEESGVAPRRLSVRVSLEIA